MKEIVEGLWEFMDLLDLTELDIDPIIDQMIDFVDSSSEISISHHNVVLKHCTNDDNIELHSNIVSHLKLFT